VKNNPKNIPEKSDSFVWHLRSFFAEFSSKSEKKKKNRFFYKKQIISLFGFFV
jgi:hypothetical protein